MKSPKDKFDAYIKLAQFWQARADTRRLYERFILFGFYVLMGIGIIYLPRDIETKKYVAIGIFGVFVFFLHGNWIASTKDKSQAFYFADAAEKVLLKDDFVAKKCPIKYPAVDQNSLTAFFSDWGVLFQLAVAVLLMFMFL